MLCKNTNILVNDQYHGQDFSVYNGDSCEVMKAIPNDSVHYSIFSPPFASLYTYSNSDRDLGNCRTRSEFYNHFKFIVSELHRIIMPGRLISFHCMNLPTMKSRDGFIGLTDFRGELIKLFQDAGFIFHSEVCIWKDPVTAMQRTKAIGLLHKQVVKDSSISRQGIPDYLITMRKLGDNPEPISGLLNDYVGDNKVAKGKDETRNSINIWQQYASPVWMDINQSNTLQRESARENEDERHICPLQLDVIARALQLWSNKGDVVFSPFGGIGSEGYQALKMGRKAIIIELKQSYYEQAKLNLISVESERNQLTFGDF